MGVIVTWLVPESLGINGLKCRNGIELTGRLAGSTKKRYNNTTEFKGYFYAVLQKIAWERAIEKPQQ